MSSAVLVGSLGGDGKTATWAHLNDFLAEVEAVFVTVPTAHHFAVAEAAAKRGVHMLLEWPPATSIKECQAMVQLAEEAGVEIGVSRPLRFHSLFAALPAAWRAELILLRRTVPTTVSASWPRWLADAVDLCCALAQTSSVQRVDAEAVRIGAPWPEAVAFGLRFHSGTYAQTSLRRSETTPGSQLYVAGPGFQQEADFHDTSQSAANVPGSEAYGNDPASLLHAETHAFVDALLDRRPVPVSALDGLHTMRLVERLMGKMR